MLSHYIFNIHVYLNQQARLCYYSLKNNMKNPPPQEVLRFYDIDPYAKRVNNLYKCFMTTTDF